MWYDDAESQTDTNVTTITRLFLQNVRAKKKISNEHKATCKYIGPGTELCTLKFLNEVK